MSRFRIYDGYKPGYNREEVLTHRKYGAVGSTVLSEAQAIMRGRKAATRQWFSRSGGSPHTCVFIGEDYALIGASNITKRLSNTNQPVFIAGARAFSVSGDGVHFVIVNSDPGNPGQFRVGVSHNGGGSFNYPLTNVPIITTVSISDDGQRIYVGRGPTYNSYRSTDGGASFTTGTAYATSGVSNDVLTMSADGMKILYVPFNASGYPRLSIDGGVTFVQGPSNGFFSGGSVSKDGSRFFLVRNVGGNRAIDRSTNNGSSWQSVSLTGGAYGLGCSEDGMIVTTAIGNVAWKSIDGGATWASFYTDTGSLARCSAVSRNGLSFFFEDVRQAIFTLQ